MGEGWGRSKGEGWGERGNIACPSPSDLERQCLSWPFTRRGISSEWQQLPKFSRLHSLQWSHRSFCLTSVNLKLRTGRYSCKWYTAAVSLKYLMKNFVLDRRGVMCAAKAMSLSKFKSQSLFWNKPPVCLNMAPNDFSTPATQAFYNPIVFFIIIFFFFFLCHNTDWRPFSIISHISSYHICHRETSLYARGVLYNVLYGEAGPRGPNLYPFKTGTPFL